MSVLIALLQALVLFGIALVFAFNALGGIVKG